MSDLLLTDFDLHLLAEGTHYRTYEKLGAHLRDRSGVAGVDFAVWAPNASRVSVVGDFNDWNPDAHPLTRRHEAGVWERFIPGVKAGRSTSTRRRARRPLLRREGRPVRLRRRDSSADRVEGRGAGGVRVARRRLDRRARHA
jgi:hypothetical protein